MTDDLASKVQVLVGGFMIHLCLGCVFLWGNLAPYVLSYFYHFGGSDGLGDKSITMNDAVFVLPINLTIVMVTNPIGAYLLKSWSPKVMLGICTAFAVLTALSASMTTKFSTFLLLYPTLFGFMMGCGYLPPLHCGWEWLPHRKGLANGLILGAFGFGSFVFS